MTGTSWKKASVSDLEQLYGTPASASILKVATHITPAYRALLEASPFFLIASVGEGGVDCSPRGELGDAFRIHDEKTILIPDRRGNNRIDTLRNIAEDGRVGFLFLIPGSGTTVRLNGSAYVTLDADLCESFTRDGKAPRSVLIVEVEEVYTQCARAVIRADLWNAEHHVDLARLPTPGDVLAEQSKGDFDGKTYDAEWPERAKKSMW